VGPTRSSTHDAVDASIPEPEREIDKPFLMAVEDVLPRSAGRRHRGPPAGIERCKVKVRRDRPDRRHHRTPAKPPSPVYTDFP